MQHGFRFDPMEYIAKDPSPQSAAARAFILERPREGDLELVQSIVERIFASQKPDGHLGADARETGNVLLIALEARCAPDRPEAQRAADAILREVRQGGAADEWLEAEGVLPIYALHALCLMGRTGEEEVKSSAEWLVANEKRWNDPWKGCPWTPAVFWKGLWAARHLVTGADATEVVNAGIRRVTDGMNAAGCNAYNDPWGFTEAAGAIDSPQARALLIKQLPMILRGQKPDGGWGQRTYWVLRALKRHDLFDPLRELPPPPPDWAVLRSIPAPEGKLSSLSWDGEKLWSFDHDSGSAVAISPADGSIVKRVPVENAHAITWGNGSLFATREEPKELLRIDPETGAISKTIPLDTMHEVIAPAVIGEKVFVGDGFLCNVCIFDIEKPGKPEMQVLAGPGPASLAAAGDALWHADFWAPAIIKSDLEGKLLEWGEQPFPVWGLAFDGEQLWALDHAEKRICVIERREDPTP
jgi:hypothetical protein